LVAGWDQLHCLHLGDEPDERCGLVAGWDQLHFLTC
jgi:hypothetical protein